MQTSYFEALRAVANGQVRTAPGWDPGPYGPLLANGEAKTLLSEQLKLTPRGRRLYEVEAARRRQQL